MWQSDLVQLSLVFFLTGIVGVVTGCTSLVTVPVLVSFGLEPRRAVATNMAALTFLSLGGCLSFRGDRLVERRHLLSIAALTAAGSLVGALLLVEVPSRWISSMILCAIACASPLVLFRKTGEGGRAPTPRSSRVLLGLVVTFVLGIYGGLFSGGYVALLSFAFLAFFAMEPLRVVATTKVANAISSAVASAIFFEQGLIDTTIAFPLGAAMFAGGFVGGGISKRFRESWLRGLFFLGILALVLKSVLSGTF